MARSLMRSGERAPQFHPSVAGISSAMEFCLRFIEWQATLKQPMTHTHIMQRWEVSRATAYRWLRAWQQAGRSR